ncbi:dihydroxy-acid dehydratase, partial [Crocinitomicaceae bacterium]|nr:dihydroxy-acid dehydratase [Crocinitomicaceae bacterium]
MIHPKIQEVTTRIIERSKESRALYLSQMRAQFDVDFNRSHLQCGNLAHAFAGCGPTDKKNLSEDIVPNIGIITAYNDMLSAHKTFEDYPHELRKNATKYNAVVQVASGVPAMCDGVTQGQDGMELSLFSRDVIAMSTVIGLSHNMFDGVLNLGICDKIVPGLLMGSLKFGH